MKVGVFTVGLPDLTPEEAVRELESAGYDGVEWRMIHVPEALKAEPPSFWGNNLCAHWSRQKKTRARAASWPRGQDSPSLVSGRTSGPGTWTRPRG